MAVFWNQQNRDKDRSSEIMPPIQRIIGTMERSEEKEEKQEGKEKKKIEGIKEILPPSLLVEME